MERRDFGRGHLVAGGTPRMTLGRALASEAMRLRRSPLVPLHAALGATLGLACGAYFGVTAWDPHLSTDAFFQLLGAGAPLLVGVSCGLSVDVEREAGEYAHLLGVPSRRLALAARTLALLALGVLAAALAGACFLGVMVALGKPVMPVPSAAAVLGMGVGSASLYVICLACALRFGRNASIALGALGLMVALASLGGLANGLVTGTLSGTFGLSAATFIPLAWPARLASLAIEFEIAGAHSVPGAETALPELARGATLLLTTCMVVTAVLSAAALALVNRFEDARRAGE